MNHKCSVHNSLIFRHLTSHFNAGVASSAFSNIFLIFLVGNGDPTSPTNSRLGELAKSLGLGVAKKVSGNGPATGAAGTEHKSSQQKQE